MNTCKYCGKLLTLTPEYDTCMECQGRIMRESTIPQGAFATNSTQTQMITHEEMLKELEGFFHMYGSNDVLRKFRKYVLEQQSKEKRAKKVEELLYWYRESWKSMRDGCLESKINKIEKDLEILK